MKFGVRECANIVFRAKQPIRIGTATFQAGQPVLYIDTATTSSMEQSTTTVYAQGGRGNARLLAWEGQKTLTFSFTDALLSPIGFAILSGAGLFKRGNGNQGEETEDLVHFHMTSGANLEISGTTGTIDLRSAIAEFGTSAHICHEDAPIYVMETEEDGSLTGRIYSGTVGVSGGMVTISNILLDGQPATKAAAVMVDYYVDLPGKHVYEADISPETFGGNYYVEADTLFRDQHTGKDLPANLTFPNVKLQSNFTMTFAGTGDPSTFDFTMDAFPDYTYFDRTKKVLAVMQIVDSIALGAEAAATQAEDPVMYHDESDQHAEAAAHDSNSTDAELGDGIAAGNFKWSNGETGTQEVNIPNVKDAISFANYVTILKADGEHDLSEFAPVFTIAYGEGTAAEKAAAAAEYVDVSVDGYIVAKKVTGETPVLVTATLPKANNNTGISLTMEIVIGAAQG